ncbi:hypothetical protein LSH36_326g02068 [Paralvinella palmiformis]|uniref:Uncharacterized protein n=1 Tax=Paralvinella palmiformis TaxID=53620 RepID=A0AAD9JGD3_9ANNE|nr:hypothetical protein LSH36_326g02068 [Paralvinella palmiformis]
MAIASINRSEDTFLIYSIIAAGDDCLGEISQTTGTCYSYHNSVVTWSGARAFCRAQGGHLAAILDISDQDVMRYLLPRGHTAADTTVAWIGAYHTKGEWTWIETGQVLSPQGCYTDRREDDKRDMEILVNVSNLTPDRCIEACRSITSPKTYQYAAVQGGSQCYCGNNTYGRYGTNTECTLNCPFGSPYYCGGRLMNFVYKIGGAYGSWVYAQPNNYKGNQNCGIIDTSQRVKMADESCFRPQAYMCEIVSASKASCLGTSSSYYYYHETSNRCFYLNETKVTWHAARERCRSLRNPGPGRLVTIDTAETHEIIRNITTRSLPVARKIWIGLYKGDGWRWTTGAAFNFSFWAPSSQLPGNPISVDTCGTLNATLSNRWTDANCDRQLPYICQGDGSGYVPLPTSTPTTSIELPTTLAPPSSGQSTSGEGDLSTIQLVLAIVMSLLGLILLIVVIYCLVMLGKKGNRVHYLYDARPIAREPNGGNSIIDEYDKYHNNDKNIMTNSTTELYRSGPW